MSILKQKHLFSFFLFVLSICNVIAQTDSTKKTIISFNIGATAETFLQKEAKTNISFGAGIMTRQRISPSSSILLMLNYQHQYFNNMQTTLYDAQYSTTVSLSTSFANEVIEIPLLYSFDYGAVSFGMGLTTSFLFHTNITQNPVGDYGTIENGITAKYHFKDAETTSPFQKVNLAPTINIALFPFKRIGVIYLLSCDVIQNPAQQYSYFNTYNLLQNKLMLTIKLN